MAPNRPQDFEGGNREDDDDEDGDDEDGDDEDDDDEDDEDEEHVNNDDNSDGWVSDSYDPNDEDTIEYDPKQEDLDDALQGDSWLASTVEDVNSWDEAINGYATKLILEFLELVFAQQGSILGFKKILLLQGSSSAVAAMTHSFIARKFPSADWFVNVSKAHELIRARGAVANVGQPSMDLVLGGYHGFDRLPLGDCLATIDSLAYSQPPGEHRGFAFVLPKWSGQEGPFRALEKIVMDHGHPQDAYTPYWPELLDNWHNGLQWATPGPMYIYKEVLEKYYDTVQVVEATRTFKFKDYDHMSAGMDLLLLRPYLNVLDEPKDVFSRVEFLLEYEANLRIFCPVQADGTLPNLQLTAYFFLALNRRQDPDVSAGFFPPGIGGEISRPVHIFPASSRMNAVGLFGSQKKEPTVPDRVSLDRSRRDDAPSQNSCIQIMSIYSQPLQRLTSTVVFFLLYGTLNRWVAASGAVQYEMKYPSYEPCNLVYRLPVGLFTLKSFIGLITISVESHMQAHWNR
ncbi:hypothetical protein B0H63DRAFT_450511 [Podospora didyma]|uniref:Uncharacterized protein n=1 Tax=Podospora didyma TaxID=330526 RepID=A0AAE0TVK4_9PEZI|nr:hypothetical protein B0H63DRAFT_450511 [Podospora didyma]